MSPRRQLGLSITFVDDDDAVMRVPGIVEKEPSPTVAVVVTPPSDERWAGFSAAEKEQSIIVGGPRVLHVGAREHVLSAPVAFRARVRERNLGGRWWECLSLVRSQMGPGIQVPSAP